MPTTPLGIPTPADSVRISQLAAAQRAGFNKVDSLLQAFETDGATRGVLPPGTDLDTLGGPESYGIWLLQAGESYPNAPRSVFTQNAILEVMPSALWRTVQRVTEFDAEHFRTAPLGLWGNWRTNVTTEGLSMSALRINRGILSPGTDLNTINKDNAGIWTLKAGESYPNAPVASFTQNSFLEVIPADDNRTIQRITEYNKMHHRTEPLGLWGNWRTGVTTETTAPLETRVTALESYSSGDPIIASRRAILMRSNGSVDFEKAADELDIPASLTKMLTAYVARKSITNARLDDVITLDTNDSLTGSTPLLKVGDVISYRSLFYLTMLPSHNVSAELLAARIGATLPGSGTGRERFLAAMNDQVAEWGWTGAVFTSASGLGTSNRATPRQIGELLWLIADTDPTLIGIMGELTKALNITGVDPRTITATHSIPPNGNPGFPEFVAGKTGTLTNTIGNVAMLVETLGVRRVIVTMGALPVNDRYPDARRILDTLGLTDLDIAGADLSGLGSHIRITNRNGWVGLSFAAAKLPAHANITGAIPSGFRPTGFSYGSLTVRDGSTIRLVEVSLTAAGTLTLNGNLTGDPLRGMVVWPSAPLTP